MSTNNRLGALVRAAVVVAMFAVPVALGAPSVARADGAIPSSAAEARKQAKALFEQGADAFTKGNYELAVDCWNKSYALSHEPVIQQQLALAYGHLGKSKEERQALKNWREVAPPEERPILDQQIANLDARIAKQDEEDRKRAEEEARIKKQLDDEKNKPRPRPGPPISIPGVIVGSAGLGAVIAGVVVDAVAASNRPDASQVCKASGANQLCLDSAKDDIQSSNTMAIAGDVTWIVGAAAVAAGVVVIIIDRPKSARPAAARPVEQHASLEIAPLVVRDAGGRSAPGFAIRGDLF